MVIKVAREPRKKDLLNVAIIELALPSYVRQSITLVNIKAQTSG